MVKSRDEALSVLIPVHKREHAGTRPLSLNLLLVAVVAVGILTLPATPYAGDPSAWQAEATSILFRGELNVPSGIANSLGEPGQFFVLNHRNGKYYSKYGTLNGILNVLPLLIGRILGDYDTGLGVLSIVLSAIIAWLLYDLTGYYTRVEWVRVGFVLLCFYTTYAWNYLRCTNSESTQWLFFLLVLRDLFLLNRTRKQAGYRLRTIGAMWFWAGCLCLTKISWVLLLPLLVAALVYPGYREGKFRSLWPGLSWLAAIVPIALICAVMAVNNWVKFGAPWLSGYHQWNDHNLKVDFMAAFRDLTLSPQWSFFICFPPLLAAIPSWRRFWCEHREESIFILAVFAVSLFMNILLGNWRGEWCYGPRYFLFILPVLALPAIYALEWAGRHFRQPAGYLTLGAIFATGLFFVAVQWQVNRLDWFFRYQVEGELVSIKDAAVHEYFEHTNYAKINWDYWRARHDLTRIPYYAQIHAGLTPEQLSSFLSDTQSLLSHPNLHWW